MRTYRRTWTLALLPLFLLAFFAKRTDAQELKDLHLRKMAAVHAEPTAKGHDRSKLRITGRLASHQLPGDFLFHPEQTPLSLSVGGVTALAGPGVGEWKQTGSYTWTYREKSERRVKLSIDFGHGDFVFRGRRLDLAGMDGPLDCDVFLFVGDLVFGTRVDGQAHGARWKWIPAGGGIPSKVPGPIPGDPGAPGGGTDPEPLSFRVVRSGTEALDPVSNTPWMDQLVVRDAGTFQREWTRMFGSGSAPDVDFGSEVVLLFYGVGDYFQVFEVEQSASGVTVRYRIASRMGPRRCIYRAVAVPRVPGGVTFQRL